MRYLQKVKSQMMTALFAFAASVLLFAVDAMQVHAYIQTQGTVISDSAVIRKEANTNSNAIASIMKGDKVTINNEETDSSGVVWYKVFVDANTLGYVRGDLIQKEGTSGTANTSNTTGSSETNTSNAGNSTSNNSTAANNNSTTPSTPQINTNLTIGANTTVTPVQSLGASVSNNSVRVRADASTSASIVTTVQKSTAITVNGQATGADGKIWYQVSFIVDGKEVSGFIRSDYVQLSGELVAIDENAPVEEPVQEPEAPAEEPIPEEPVNTDYVLKYETNEEGINEWYLYNNIESKKNKLSEILDAAEGNGEAVDRADAQLKKQKVIIILLAILLVFLALAVTLLLFKIRDMYYDDFDNYEEEPEQPRRSQSATPRTVKPVQGERPAARPQGNPQNRPANGQPRPQGKPQGNSQNRPANGQSRPQGNSQNRPANGQPRPQGNPQSRPANGQPRPQGNPQGRPVNEQTHPQTAGKADAGWKAKNFMADDDDFEFEFLNWDGEEK